MTQEKVAVILLYVGLLATSFRAQNANLLRVPVCLDGKTVYINRDGQVVLKAPFDSAHFRHFSDGLAAFVINHKVGFINDTGRIAIKPVFESAGDFSEGFASIYVNTKSGFINRAGKIIVSPIYDFVWDFSNGFARVGIENGKDNLGLPKYKIGFVDKTGRIVVGRTKASRIGYFDDARDFSDGLAPVKIGNKWGYVNGADQIIIRPQFEDAKPFSEGLAPATIDGKLWGYIDRKGSFVIQPQFTDAENFAEGLAVISTDKSGGLITLDTGFIDKSGQIVIKPAHSFVLAYKFQEGRSYYYWKDGAKKDDPLHGAFIDSKGSLIYQGDDVWLTPFFDGTAAIATKAGISYIDLTGRYIWDASERKSGSKPKCNEPPSSFDKKTSSKSLQVKREAKP